LIRGHTYRLGLKAHSEGKGILNAVITLDYKTGDWGLWWNDLKVSIAPDLAEEIEKLKKRVDALENHTHTYLTGRGEGHNNTEVETSKPILVDVDDPTAEEKKLLPAEDGADALPVKSVFLNNAPNPFNPSTTITYTLPERLLVTIRLYDAQGRLARTLVSEDRDKGPHAIAFDGEGLASGVYYYRLTAGKFSETRKLTIVR
ncbi:MAG TPA: T9SS type A sorting domain-containing protein, partial [Candidatus Eisenbacteria bacterium]